MQHDTATNNTDGTKLSDKKSLKINLTHIESNSTTVDIFGMNASVEKNYHMASD